MMIPITSSRTLGQVLRLYRKKMGLSQAEVGNKFNMSQKVISTIESGRPGVRLETLFKLMAALGLEIYLKKRTEGGSDEVLW